MVASYFLYKANGLLSDAGQQSVLLLIGCPIGLSDHKRCYECKDRVELRESGVDHGVGLYVVTL